MSDAPMGGPMGQAVTRWLYTMIKWFEQATTPTSGGKHRLRPAARR